MSGCDEFELGEIEIGFVVEIESNLHPTFSLWKKKKAAPFVSFLSPVKSKRLLRIE
jgi:hypothetical protein